MKKRVFILAHLIFILFIIPIANASCDDDFISPAFIHFGSADCPINDEVSEELVFNDELMTKEGIDDLCDILRETQRQNKKPLSFDEKHFLDGCIEKLNPTQEFLDVLTNVFRVGTEGIEEGSFLSDDTPAQSSSHETDISLSYVQPEHSMLRGLFDKKIITLEKLRKWGIAH